MKILGFSMLAVGLMYVAICLFMFFSQNRLIHIPYEQLANTPLEYGMHYEDVDLEAKDGARLHAWYIPHPEAQFTFWIFCGNSGNKSYMLDSARLIHSLGHAVFIYDYRGFGPSTGQLSEQAMYEDTELVWHYLTQTRGILADRIVLHGRSLGTAMASWIATKTSPAALIMESGFTSMNAMAKDYYSWLPIDLLLQWNYDNLTRMSSISIPILFIHSPDDEITPYEHSKQLFEATPGSNKSFLTISGDHLEGFIESGSVYTDGIIAFMEDFV